MDSKENPSFSSWNLGFSRYFSTSSFVLRIQNRSSLVLVLCFVLLSSMERKNRDFMSLERESAVSVLKPQLIFELSQLIKFGSDREEFLKFCKRVEYVIRAWYHLQFEDVMQLYSLFDPSNGELKIDKCNLSSEKIEDLEQGFLKSLFQVIEKANFKMASDEEIEIALSEKYLLNLPITVDESKLDSKLLEKYFKENPKKNLPGFSHKYIIFHRGVGIDETSDYFILEKLDMIISRFWNFLLNVIRLQPLLSKHRTFPEKGTEKNDHLGEDSRQEKLIFERVRIENMKFSMNNIFGKITIQEPTFQRIIVIYRRASSREKTERGICIKHFKNIPMADMELVLPEKKNPSLTPMDWVQFLISAVIGLVTLITSLDKPKADFRVVMAIFVGLVGYCARIYFLFQQNMKRYQNLITRSMYDKQLDSGRGTLLHLCDDVIQQEVKEVIISFFILMEQGKATKEELDFRCEELLEEQFGEKCNFEVDDAVHKLERLGIVTLDANNKISPVRLKHANEIIGMTTEELILKAKKSPPA